jgi:hypothetical protein
MLIEWAVMATVTVVVGLLIARAIGRTEGRMDKHGPGEVSAGPVFVTPRERRPVPGQFDSPGEDRGEAAA